jgi:hypothetical protein
MHHLSVFNNILPNIHRAEEIARWELALGERLADPTCIHTAHFDIAVALMLQGRVHAARNHFETVVDWYDPARHRTLSYEYGMSLGVASLMWLSMTLWLLGHPDAASNRGREAVEMAEALDHPFSNCVARQVAGSFVHGLRCEHGAGLAQAEASLEVATEHTLGYHQAVGAMHCAWHRLELSESGEDIEELVTALEDYVSTGSRVFETHFHVQIADALRRAERYEEAWKLLEETEACIDPRGE